MALVIFPRQLVVDSNGTPRVGANLYVYDAGTSSTTPHPAYTTPALDVPHSSPISSLSSGLFPAVYVDPNDGDYKLVCKDSSGVTIWTEDDLSSVVSQADIGASLYPRTAAESTAGVTPTNFGWRPGEAPRYGADITGVADSTAAFNTALSCNKAVYGLGYPYRIDGSITVNSGKFLIGGGSSMTRGGAATTPMLYVLGESSGADGLYLVTANASPNGCVVLGHQDAFSDTNAWWWRFTNSTVSGRANQAGDYGVVVPSGQVDFPLRANYFGTIQNINIYGFDIQMYLPELANAHSIHNVEFWNGKTDGLRLRGAYANKISHLTFHQSAADGYVAIRLQNQVDPGGQHHSIFNQITDWVAETTNASDRSVVIESMCDLNHVIGGSNDSGGYTIGNLNNFVVINGAIITTTSAVIGGNAQVGGILTVSGARAVLGLTSLENIPAVTGVSSGSGTGAGSATTIIPSALLSVALQKAVLILVQVTNTTVSGNLSRTDLLLLNLRNSSHSPSTVTAVANAITSTGGDGEPTAVAYTLSFADGAALPKLQAAVTSIGGPQVFTFSCALVREG